MPDESRVRVYIACSLDGFIAGEGDDLSWLASSESASDRRTESDPGAVSFEDYMRDVGALLMGRRTYDVVAGFGGAWPYGERPVLVATRRPLEPIHPWVRPIEGEIAHMVAAARAAAGARDVYIDGGDLIRQALDADLVDHLIVTMVPVVLGRGHPLFAGVAKRHSMELLGHHRFEGGMVQLHFRPTGAR